VIEDDPPKNTKREPHEAEQNHCLKEGWRDQDMRQFLVNDPVPARHL
jgi:hypothetical protein